MNAELLTIPQIIETFDKNTTLKARCLLSDFSEMTIEGQIYDVASGEDTLPGILRIVLKPKDAPDHRPFTAQANFNAVAKDKIFERLTRLQKNETVKIVGKIEYVTPTVLSLKDSEIIEMREATQMETGKATQEEISKTT